VVGRTPKRRIALPFEQAKHEIKRPRPLPNAASVISTFV
jgi:hypothetical protein